MERENEAINILPLRTLSWMVNTITKVCTTFHFTPSFFFLSKGLTKLNSNLHNICSKNILLHLEKFCYFSAIFSSKFKSKWSLYIKLSTTILLFTTYISYIIARLKGHRCLLNKSLNLLSSTPSHCTLYICFIGWLISTVLILVKILLLVDCFYTFFYLFILCCLLPPQYSFGGFKIHCLYSFGKLYI